jgi:serine/threonine protein kinase
MYGVVVLFCITWLVEVINFNIGFPFDGKDSNDLLNNILAGNFTYPKNISKQLIDLLMRIFATNPKMRYTIEQIKHHSWFEWYYILTKVI